MTDNTQFISCEVSKKGFPVLWEVGGGYSSTGNAVIIAGPKGEKKQPIFTGHRACDKHALFYIEPNDIYIRCSRHRENATISVLVLNKFDAETKKISVKERYDFSDGEWTKEIPSEWENAVKACVNKTWDYHCRDIYWALPFKSRY